MQMMAQMRLIRGAAGSGKTHSVLREIAQAVAGAQDCGTAGLLGADPLYFIVPEQQALTLERALVAEAGKHATGRNALSVARVTSFSRLGRLLAEAAGIELEGHISQLGRELLAWRITPAGSRREAQALELADMLAELELYARAPFSSSGSLPAEGLRQRLAELREQLSGAGERAGRTLQRTADKLATLLDRYSDYQQLAKQLNLQVVSPVSYISASLMREVEHGPWGQANPLLRLSRARIWLDGFMGMTPLELNALRELGSHCRDLTVTLLLDPAADGQEGIGEDWYYPTRQLQTAIELVARDTGSRIEHIDLPGGKLPRFSSPVLAQLATHGPQTGMAVSQPGEGGGAVTTQACDNPREEIEHACRQIRRLVSGNGWRFRDVVVLARGLEQYRELVVTLFADYRIPYYLDSRIDFNSSPVAEYIRSALRLACNVARREDIAALLQSGMLDAGWPAGGNASGQLRRLLWLAQQRNLPAGAWLWETPWELQPGWLESRQQNHEQAELERLHNLRRELFAPIAELGHLLRPAREGALPLSDALGHCWRLLMPEAVQTHITQLKEEAQERLQQDGDPQSSGDTAVEAGRQALAARRYGAVVQQVAELWDELAQVGGGVQLGPGSDDGADQIDLLRFTRWVEFGLGQLAAGFAPPVGDAVLVTDVERGRLPEARCVLLIGMTEEQWPRRSGPPAYFSDTQRALVNGISPGERIPDKLPGRLLLGPGQLDQLRRESYFALVACSRAGQQLYASYPAGSTDGAEQQPSRYFKALEQLGRQLQSSEAHKPDVRMLPEALDAWNNGQLLDVAAQPQAAGELRSQLLELAAGSPAAQAVQWQRAVAESDPGTRLSHAGYWRSRLLCGHDDSMLMLSASQLETFAACPYKHYARYLLRLAESEERGFGAREIGELYHHVFRSALEPVLDKLHRAGLAEASLDWLTEVLPRAHDEVQRLADELARTSGRRRAQYLAQRGGLVLRHLARYLATQYSDGGGRLPWLVEARFGPGKAALPPVDISAGSLTARLRGQIDRVDVDRQGNAYIVDYKLTGKSLQYWQFASGLALQLPVYLLAVQGRQAAGSGTLTPVQAEYQGIEPENSLGKPINYDAVKLPGKSIVKKLAKQDYSQADVTGALLEQAAELVAGLAVRLAGMEVSTVPLMQPDGRPVCGSCPYMAVCRFDPRQGGKYRPSPPAGREQSKRWTADLAALLVGKAGGGNAD